MLRVLLVIDDYGELIYLQTLLRKLGFDVDGIQNPRSFEDSLLSMNPEVVIATAKGKKVNGLQLAQTIKRPRGLPKVVLLVPSQIVEKLKGMTLLNIDGIAETPVRIGHLLVILATVGDIDPHALLEKYRSMRSSSDEELTDHASQAQVQEEEDLDSESFVESVREQQKSDYGLQIVTGDVKAAEKAETSTDSASGSGLDGVEPVIELEIDESQNNASEAKPIRERLKTSLSEDERAQRFAKAVKEPIEHQDEVLDQKKVRQFNKEIRQTESLEESADLDKERREFVKALFKKKK